MDKIESKCVKLQVTRKFIAEMVAGRMKPVKPIIHLQKELKNNYVYYNADKDIFEIVYYTDDCPEGTVPDSISAIEFQSIELNDYIKKDKIEKVIDRWIDLQEDRKNLKKELGIEDLE